MVESRIRSPCLRRTRRCPLHPCESSRQHWLRRPWRVTRLARQAVRPVDRISAPIRPHPAHGKHGRRLEPADRDTGTRLVERPLRQRNRGARRRLCRKAQWPHHATRTRLPSLPRAEGHAALGRTERTDDVLRKVVEAVGGRPAASARPPPRSRRWYSATRSGHGPCGLARSSRDFDPRRKTS